LKFLHISIIALSFLFSCKNESKTQAENQKIILQESSDPHVRNTQKMLQGTWINQDEKGVTLVFDKNTRIENVKGKPSGKTRYFKISNFCENNIPGSEFLAQSKAKYISMQDIDMCFFIVNLNKEHLDLKVVGRGNILRYRKQGIKSKKSSNQNTNQLKREEK